MLFVFVCAPVHAYGHFDRCWTAVVMDFNIYLAAPPTGGWHKLYWQGVGVKFGRPAIQRHRIMTKVQCRGGETVTGLHRSVMGIQNKRVTVGMEKRVGTEV